MIYIVQNLLPILLATLAGLGFGAFFYHIFGGGASWKLLPVAFLAEFWLAAILAGALILAPSQAGAWTMALGSAFVIWIGFVLPSLWVTHRLHGLSVRIATIDAAHWLGTMLVQAAVLQVIGLGAPAAAMS